MFNRSGFSISTFLLGVVSTVFVLHAWQLFTVRSMAKQALEQSQINSKHIQEIATFLGSKAQATPTK